MADTQSLIQSLRLREPERTVYFYDLFSKLGYILFFFSICSFIAIFFLTEHNLKQKPTTIMIQVEYDLNDCLAASL